MQGRFSDRHGYRGTEQEIAVREEAPEGLRFAIPLIAQDAGMSPDTMRRVICGVLLVRADPSNWSDYPNIWDEVNGLIGDCPWFKVYDVAEAIHAALAARYSDGADLFQDRLNSYFRENGIGWQMTGGRIVYRGSEAFAEATREAAAVLAQTGRSAAANEVHEALADISRRPKPDITGAVQHSIAALECTARDVTGEPNLTLGRLVPRLALTPPLDTAVEKLWGYASERARHVREGQAVSSEEAELVVSVACAVCTFLSKRDRS
ncbi:AbiJ-NTD4 domain-containing protein [Methylocella sp.]|uniref:AbiJ-NTD4 domain-containing protein n=1 Tax=Methylocella sp. TaxID=1978226 RepID=UPI003784BEF8